MSDVIKSDPNSINDPGDSYVNTVDADPAETQEWLESLQYVLGSKGPERVKFLLSVLEAKALVDGVDMPAKSNTAYINTISKEDTPQYPGNAEIERRIRSFIRWNAMAMVVKANKVTKAFGSRRWAHQHLCFFGHALRSCLQPYFPWPRRIGIRRRPNLFPRPWFAWNVLACLYGRTFQRRRSRQLSS